MIAHKGDDRLPIVQDFARQGADFLGIVVLVASAGFLEARQDRVQELMVLFLGDRLDEGSEFPHQPVAEPRPVVVVAADQRDAFPDRWALCRHRHKAHYADFQIMPIIMIKRHRVIC